MITIFFGTSNRGKQNEITRFAESCGKVLALQFPDEGLKLNVEESGETFEENATLKARAYQQAVGGDSVVFVGDDSGIKIPALNDEPGVFTRRWVGHEMTDREILDYCMEKMKDLKGDERKAVFETTLVALQGEEAPRVYRGQMWGRILEEPVEATPIDGFPFRSIFWVDELECPIYELHGLAPEERHGFLTHREKAFEQLFNSLRNSHKR